MLNRMTDSNPIGCSLLMLAGLFFGGLTFFGLAGYGLFTLIF